MEQGDGITSCLICNNSLGNTIYPVREMMQGTRHIFQYMECAFCGCLQLLDPPADMSPYYALNYYSLQQDPARLFKPAIKGRLKAFRDYYAITGNGVIGRLINNCMPSPNIELYHLRKLGLKKKFRMLDVGAGAGMLTYILYNAGFKGITGIDPYLQRDVFYQNGLVIKRMALEDVTVTNLDVVFFHHSFEHFSDPKVVLKHLYEILRPGGQCIIRVPTTSSFAWQHYREHWVQLDAPRHYFLYTVDAIKTLASESCFSFTYLADESTSFQFTGSEQYKMDIPLRGDKRSYFEKNKKLFTNEQIAAYSKKAFLLNKQRNGDCIAVLLRKESK